MSTGIGVVFAIIIAALVLFVWEPFPIDVTAVGIIVALVLLEPWTEISASEGVSGFSNPATITILAMMIVSEGVRRTGIIQRLAAAVASYTGSDPHKQLGATIGLVTPFSALMSNTAAVAMLLPMVSDLAHEHDTSPSKLLLALSYASMLAGMLTLLGTSTNILASSISDDLLGHPFSMFEFTSLGIIVFAAGTVYLLTVGYWLAPAHVTPRSKRQTAGQEEFLTEIRIGPDSPLADRSLGEALEVLDFEGTVTQLIRRDEYRREPELSVEIEPGDIYTVRLTPDALRELIDIPDVDIVPDATATGDLELLEAGQTLVEIVVRPGSELIGETIESAKFGGQYPAGVLAIQRGGEKMYSRLPNVRLESGDVMLVGSTEETVEQLADNPNIIVAGELQLQKFRSDKMPVALATIAGIIGLVATGYASLVTASLAGAFVLMSTGVVRPPEAYETVRWDVIFLLAGVIPLGEALSQTGGAKLLGTLAVESATWLPLIGVMALFYILTATLTNMLSNQAVAVLMLPVAVDTAKALGAEPFSFVLAVTFAASAAFAIPVGYQTNLFVYGPGSYNFSDFLRVGLPLQVICGVATIGGIWVLWGI
jgi:di/tricarboxylate transporter